MRRREAEEAEEHRHDRRRHDGAAEAVGEVHGDRGAGEARHEAAERQREVGDGQAGAEMAHQRAGEDLQIDERHEAEGWADRHVALFHRAQRAVRARGEESDGDVEAEEDLGEPGVRDGDRVRQQEDHRQSAEDALGDHGADGAPAERAHEALPLAALQPDRLHDGEEADRRGDHAVAVLVEDAADHRREDLSVRQRPVGDGEAGAGRRHHRAGEDQEKGGEGHELGETPQPVGSGIVRGTRLGDAFHWEKAVGAVDIHFLNSAVPWMKSCPRMR